MTPALVLDIGSAVARVGAAGDALPRFQARPVLPPQCALRRSANCALPSADDWKIAALSLLSQCIGSHLGAREGDGRRIVLVDSLALPRPFVAALREQARVYYKCPEVVIIPAPVAVAAAAGVSVGVCVDAGATSTRAAVVCDGAVLPETVCCGPCVPDSLADEEPDSECDPSALLCEALRRCPVDLRRAAASNILAAGGRLRTFSLRKVLEDAGLKSLVDCAKWAPCAIPAESRAFAGASVLAGTLTDLLASHLRSMAVDPVTALSAP